MNKMAIVSPYLSIITLNVNALIFLIIRHKVTEWNESKTRSNNMLPTKIHFNFRDTHNLKAKKK